MLPGANISRLLGACGFKWILVDMEHGNIDGIVTPNLADLRVPNTSVSEEKSIFLCHCGTRMRQDKSIILFTNIIMKTL